MRTTPFRHLLLAPTLLAAALPASAQISGPRIVTGAGLVDYSRLPFLKAGMFARYLILTSSPNGQTNAEQKITVGPNETVNGDTSVWIETEFTDRAGKPVYSRTLVSNTILQAEGRNYIKLMPEYQRKVQVMKRMGGVVEELAFNRSLPLGPKNIKTMAGGFNDTKETRDTLEWTEVVTDAGKFRALPCRYVRDLISFGPPKGGGRRYHRQYEEQISFRNDQIPVTGLVQMFSRMRTWDGQLPPTAPNDTVPDFPMVESQSVVKVASFGNDGALAFPAVVDVVPMNMQDKAPGR